MTAPPTTSLIGRRRRSTATRKAEFQRCATELAARCADTLAAQLRLTASGLQLLTAWLVGALLRRPAKALEAIGKAVRVLPDDDLEIAHAPLHRSRMRGKQNIKTVSLDRAADIEHGNRGAPVVTRNTDERPKWKRARVGCDQGAAVRKDRVATRRDAVRTRAAAASIGAVRGDAHAKRVHRTDGSAIELAKPDGSEVRPLPVHDRRSATSRKGKPVESARANHFVSKRPVDSGRVPTEVRSRCVGQRRGSRTHGNATSGDAKRDQCRGEPKDRGSRNQGSASTRNGTTQTTMRFALDIVIEVARHGYISTIRLHPEFEVPTQCRQGRADRMSASMKCTADSPRFMLVIRLDDRPAPQSGTSCASVNAEQPAGASAAKGRSRAKFGKAHSAAPHSAVRPQPRGGGGRDQAPTVRIECRIDCMPSRRPHQGAGSQTVSVVWRRAPAEVMTSPRRNQPRRTHGPPND